MDEKRILRNLTTLALLAVTLLVAPACNQWAFPRIDPTGQRIFAQGSTTAAIAPTGPGCLQRLRGNTNGFNPLASPALNPQPVAPQAIVGPVTTAPIVAPVAPVIPLPQAIQPLVNVPAMGAQAAKAPPCEYQGAIGSCLELRRKAKELGVPATNPNKLLHRGERGELNLTPARIVAPVGSEVVVMGGICGGDGYFVPHQPIEFNLSQDSVGQITDSSSRHINPVTKWLKASTRKESTDFLTMFTSLREETIDRGTPTPVDDIHVEKGQAWISVHSASPGTSYITAIAPKAEAWDKRLKTTEIQWVDALWNIPTPATATAGAKYPLTTVIRKADDGLGVGNWKVRYEIAGGAPAEFLPTKSQTAEVVSGPDGNASVEIQQPEGQTGPGTTFIRVDIVRPAANSSSGYEVIESAVTNIRWVAPALTIRAIGPKTVATTNPFTYRLEITNPGDQVARDSFVALEGLPEGLVFVGSTPKPTVYGDRLEWSLGDIPPGTQPNIIDIQFKSQSSIGIAQLCFDVESKADLLKTRACAETQIVAPCLGVSINGPKEARVGSEVEFVLTFVNQCQEDLTGLRADVRLGSGIEVVGRTGGVSFSLDRPLKFNESKSLPLMLRVHEEGNHCFQIDMQADGGHTASIRRCIVARDVNEPSITLEVSGQVNTQVNQRERVQARVVNTGNVPLTNVIVTNSVSLNSLQPLAALPEGVQQGDQTVFQIGSLPPNGSQLITIEYETIAIDGNGFSRFDVLCDQLVQDAKEIPIRIVGQDGTVNANPVPPANPIQVPGAVDPGVLGQLGIDLFPAQQTVRLEEFFNLDVQITNGRSVSDQNIQITLDKPPGLQFVGTTNPNVQFMESPDGLQYKFSPIAELRPGARESLGLRFKGVQRGTAEVTVGVQSQSSVIPVVKSATVNIN